MNLPSTTTALFRLPAGAVVATTTRAVRARLLKGHASAVAHGRGQNDCPHRK